MVRRSVVLACALGAACSPSSRRHDAPAVIGAPAPAHHEVAADARAAAPSPSPDAAPALAIVEAPIAWSAERERLTLAYRRAHSDPTAPDLAIDPHVIVLHFTGGSSAADTRAYFDNVRIEASRKQLARAGAVNVSSHFLVDRDGTIYRLQPETRFARHCIGLNHVAIGIENVGVDANALTDAQVAADAALVRDLAHRFTITHLVGHHEVMAWGKQRDNPYYRELDASYRNDKPDPGAAFMTGVRAAVADLGLSGPS